MMRFFKESNNNCISRILHTLILSSFVFSLILPPSIVSAQLATNTVLDLPEPGRMLLKSTEFEPLVVQGITIFPDNPLLFDFIVNVGEEKRSDDQIKAESNKLIKYFLASLTTPDDELWVNLSPYEKDHIIPESFGQTEMGRDLLAQDYLLKQLTASLMYPEDDTGREFWNRVYAKAEELYGTREIPLNTFNKVWIVPQNAVVYESGLTAFILESELDVMLEEDYIARKNNLGKDELGTDRLGEEDVEDISNVTSDVVRDVLIPEIRYEVNHGKTFANLRKIYHSMILATWYKKRLRETLLGQVYMDQNKIVGVDVDDPTVKEKIYDQYLAAFRKGVYNLVKDEYNPKTGRSIPRKYFSGGFASFKERPEAFKVVLPETLSPAQTQKVKGLLNQDVAGNFRALRTQLGEAMANPRNAKGARRAWDLQQRGIDTVLGASMRGELDWMSARAVTPDTIKPPEMKEIINVRNFLGALRTSGVVKTNLEQIMEDLYQGTLPVNEEYGKAPGIVFHTVSDQNVLNAVLGGQQFIDGHASDISLHLLRWDALTDEFFAFLGAETMESAAFDVLRVSMQEMAGTPVQTILNDRRAVARFEQEKIKYGATDWKLSFADTIRGAARKLDQRLANGRPATLLSDLSRQQGRNVRDMTKLPERTAYNLWRVPKEPWEGPEDSGYVRPRNQLQKYKDDLNVRPQIVHLSNEVRERIISSGVLPAGVKVPRSIKVIRGQGVEETFGAINDVDAAEPIPYYEGPFFDRVKAATDSHYLERSLIAILHPGDSRAKTKAEVAYALKEIPKAELAGLLPQNMQIQDFLKEMRGHFLGVDLTSDNYDKLVFTQPLALEDANNRFAKILGVKPSQLARHLRMKEVIELNNHQGKPLLNEAWADFDDSMNRILVRVLNREMDWKKGKRVAIFAAALNPPTLAHTISTITKALSVSGMDKVYLSMTKGDYRKMELALAQRYRDPLIQKLILGLFQKLVVPLTSINKSNKRYTESNGENNTFHMAKDKVFEEATYGIGLDHFKVFEVEKSGHYKFATMQNDGTAAAQAVYDDFHTWLSTPEQAQFLKDVLTLAKKVEPRALEGEVLDKKEEPYKRKKVVDELLAQDDLKAYIERQWKAKKPILLPKMDTMFKLPSIRVGTKTEVTALVTSRRGEQVVPSKLLEKLLGGFTVKGRTYKPVPVIFSEGINFNISATNLRNYLKRVIVEGTADLNGLVAYVRPYLAEGLTNPNSIEVTRVNVVQPIRKPFNPKGLRSHSSIDASLPSKITVEAIDSARKQALTEFKKKLENLPGYSGFEVGPLEVNEGGERTSFSLYAVNDATKAEEMVAKVNFSIWNYLTTKATKGQPKKVVRTARMEFPELWFPESLNVQKRQTLFAQIQKFIKAYNPMETSIATVAPLKTVEEAAVEFDANLAHKNPQKLARTMALDVFKEIAEYQKRYVAAIDQDVQRGMDLDDSVEETQIINATSLFNMFLSAQEKVKVRQAAMKFLDDKEITVKELTTEALLNRSDIARKFLERMTDRAAFSRTDTERAIPLTELRSRERQATRTGVLRPDDLGGIDLNPANLNLEIRRDENGIPLPINLQPVEDININGFIPVIINVAPVTNLQFLLGLNKGELQEQKTNLTPTNRIKKFEEVGQIDQDYAHKQESFSLSLN